MRIKLLYILIFFPLLTLAQDPTLTSPLFNKTYLNPAFLGMKSNGDLVFGSIVKNSFYPIRGPFNLYSFNSEITKKIANIDGGLGLTYTSERQGDGFFENNNLILNFGGKIKIYDNIFLKVAIGPNLLTKKIDWNEFTFSDQLNPIYGITNTSVNHNLMLDNTSALNINLGINLKFDIIKNNSFLIGGALFNLSQPQIGFLSSSYLPRRYVINAAHYGKSTDKKLEYETSLFMIIQNNFYYFMICHQTELSKLFGLGFTLKSSFINSDFLKNNFYGALNVRFKIKDEFRIIKDINLFLSAETNVLGIELAGYTKTFEIGILGLLNFDNKKGKDCNPF
jgi:hypothetical protein